MSLPTEHTCTDEHGDCSGCRWEWSSRDAGLGVGHIWTAVDCLAYRTLDGADCTCNNSFREEG